MSFGAIASSNSTEETRALEKELSPLFSAHYDDIYLNPQLFAKVKEVYDNQKKFGLDQRTNKITGKRIQTLRSWWCRSERRTESRTTQAEQ